MAANAIEEFIAELIKEALKNGLAFSFDTTLMGVAVTVSVSVKEKAA